MKEKRTPDPAVTGWVDALKTLYGMVVAELDSPQKFRLFYL